MSPTDIAPYCEYDPRYSADSDITDLVGELYGDYCPLAWLQRDGTVLFETLKAASSSLTEKILIVRADPGYWHPHVYKYLASNSCIVVVDSMREVSLVARFLSHTDCQVEFLTPSECLRRAGFAVRPSQLRDHAGNLRFVEVGNWIKPHLALDSLDWEISKDFRMFSGVHTVEPGTPLFVLNVAHPFGLWLSLQPPEETASFVTSLLTEKIMLFERGDPVKRALLQLLAKSSVRKLPFWPTELFFRSIGIGRPNRRSDIWQKISEDGSTDSQFSGIYEDREQWAWWQ